MIHLAVDHGKKVSHAVALTDAGEVLFDQQIPTTLEGFASIKEALNPKFANTIKTRYIAESFTKTDRIDATTHAIMLRAGITPLVHVPCKETRDQKNLLRHRFWLVRCR